MKRLRRFGLGLAALLFLMQFCFVVLPPAALGQSANFLEQFGEDDSQADFLDKITIEFRGRAFTDSNPYDERIHYLAGPASGIPACNEEAEATRRHELTINNYDSDNPTADIKLRSSDGGECVTEEFNNVPMKHKERKRWTTYRQSSETLFAPKGTKWDIGTCNPADDISVSRPNVGKVTVDEPKQYRRLDGQARNDYFEVDGDEVTTKNKFKITDNPVGGIYIDVRCDLPDVPFRSNEVVKSWSWDDRIYLAFDGESVNSETATCIPRYYGNRTGTCPPELDPYDLLSSDTDNAEDACLEAMSQNDEGSWGWVICPVLNTIDTAANEVLDQLTDLLDFDPSQFQDSRLRAAWAYFRNFASFALLVIGLVMVIGQAVNRE